MSDLSMFFKPSSIAVVGASSDPSKGGNMILTNIARSWGTNRLYPVNPRGEEIMGMRVYKSLEDIPEEQIDLVILFIPSRFIIQVLEQCVKKEVRGVIIESAGFAEVGKEGKKI
ncbi:MAG: CoA-binding protein, partial [Candidatus Hodarchaeales archaeon]